MFQVLIVGASVGGLATALQLHHRDVSTFQVIDAASSSATAATGRAVGLWTNAWQVLDALGIGAQVRQACPWNTTQFWVHDLHADDVSARTSLRCFSLPKGQEFRRVPIKVLTETLAASIPPERLHYGTSLDRWLQEQEQEREARSGHSVRANLDEVFVVGADGARSMVRSRLLGCGEPLRHAGYVAHTGIAYLPRRNLSQQNFKEADTLQELSCPGRVILLLGRGDGTRLGVQRIDDQTVFWFFCENVRSSEKDELRASLPLQRGNETKQRVWAVLSRPPPDSARGALERSRTAC
ncbi:hypothetical protein F1559_003172 [Cyanidiococcus yangmingshanensis]|uniref:FAD-binding domain-containing protein n=1 Tax=Cyanidiococcus yangmingshanensis TaxID=2690220 RepID=A0A7J7IJA1_9RHOD|nr:hypothetical protein F1559_003172 [Cyanidiococcus yangmingshanensis]